MTRKNNNLAALTIDTTLALEVLIQHFTLEDDKGNEIEEDKVAGRGRRDDVEDNVGIKGSRRGWS